MKICQKLANPQNYVLMTLTKRIWKYYLENLQAFFESTQEFCNKDPVKSVMGIS